MTKIIGVKFKSGGKMYYFDPMDFDIERGMYVVVETSRGMEYGEVTVGVKEIEDSTVTKPLKGVLRIATKEDTLRFNTNKEKEKEAYRVCLEKIEKHGLDMKLIEVEYTFDGNKILFYFTSDGRVDFRDLVKDLAAVFKTRIELRQIGVRDESKTLGSIGVCGRNLCCSQFLGEFVPVSIKMAKEQGLSLNPSKISGACGRLMCCLKYEQDTYEILMNESPKMGAEIYTPDGKGRVVSVALIRGKVKVRLEGDSETTIKEYSVKEVSTNENEVKKEFSSENNMELKEPNVEKNMKAKKHNSKPNNAQRPPKPKKEKAVKADENEVKESTEKKQIKKPFRHKSPKKNFTRKEADNA